MNIKKQISELVISAVMSLFEGVVELSENSVKIESPSDKTHGDYASSIAMVFAKNLQKNPREIAVQIANEIWKADDGDVLEVCPEVAGAGFINFRVSKKTIILKINEAVKNPKFGNGESLNGKKVMVEFACPNTHKLFHIGHLRNILLGESLARLLESQNAKVFRANYQGDIGPHVAKSIWGMKNMDSDAKWQKIETAEDARSYEKTTLLTPKLKSEFLGQAYATGGSAYESDDAVIKEKTRAEVMKINKDLYAGTEPLFSLWNETKSWSLEYFDEVYKKLGTKFDHLFFESEMYEKGKEIILKNLACENPIFEKSEGAIVFKGENYGLHTRVFITKDGNATYECKELANMNAEYEKFNFDYKIHVVGNEQAGYFQVVFKAGELLFPFLHNNQRHLSYGMVNLTTGKMSSRKGAVIEAEWLIDQVKERVGEVSESAKNLSAEIIETIAINAVKFTMLYADAKKDISFDIEKSVKLTGDSGPYVLYGYTRILSILEKVASDNFEPLDLGFEGFNDQDFELAKKLFKFEEEVLKSATEYTTHNLVHYLLELVSEFSRWYESNRILESEEGLKMARITLLHAIKRVIENAFYLLGMTPVSKM